MSQQETAVKPNLIVYAAGLVILILGISPIVDNLKYSDFSKNWLNHDYGKNLLSSTQEYSVFMTEGGDNQVFGSLYFTYAVKLRQDLFPYDQKGNIFKRIYGDMRYVTANTVDQRMQIVDSGLFSGEEPFYEAIRSDNPPYLVPYALGRPSTYLTWKRPRQFMLGDYYYKSYGIMYKVQPIRYAMMDILSVIQSASIQTLKERVVQELGRNPSDQEMNNWINELIAEGLVSKRGSVILFVKDYPKPFNRDPRDTFIKRWDDIKNLPYYDNLSREIVIGYAYESLIFLGDQIKNWEYLYQAGTDPAQKIQTKENIDKAWEEIDKLTELAKKAGYDSPSVLHNLGILYLSYEREYQSRKVDKLAEAIELWDMGVQKYPYGWNTYNVLLWASLQAVYRYPAETQKYLDIFDSRLTMMTNNMKHWKSMAKDVTKAEPYKQVLSFINLRKNIDANAASRFDTELKDFIAMMNSSTVDTTKAQEFIQAALTRQGFVPNQEVKKELSKAWVMLWNLNKKNPDFVFWHLRQLSEASAYSDFIDDSVFEITIKEGLASIPSPIQGERDLSSLISFTKIAAALGNVPLKDASLARIYRDAKASLSPSDYAVLKRQLDQFAASL